MAIDYIYSDIDIQLTRQTNGDVTKFTEENAIKQSLINILSTKKGDRRMYPTFGASLEEFLFEPMDKQTADRIGNTILEEIVFWDDRLVVEQIHVNANHDNQQYEINIYYYIRGNNNTGTQNISFVLRGI